MNEIVKYDNQLNEIALRKFNSVELDILMSICAKMKELDEETIVFKFEELRKLSNYSGHTIKDFVKYLDTTYQKLINLNFKIGNDIKFTRFVLFTKYDIDCDYQNVTIRVNSEFKFVLNELTSNFTRFELQEFVKIKSSYSKEVFRRLKQFRHTGIWKIHIDDFRNLMDVPDGYRMSEIDKFVLNRAKTDLSSIFKNLKITKIKAKNRRNIEYLEFKFEKEIRENTALLSKNKTKNLKFVEVKDFVTNKKNLTEKENNLTKEEFEENKRRIREMINNLTKK